MACEKDSNVSYEKDVVESPTNMENVKNTDSKVVAAAKNVIAMILLPVWGSHDNPQVFVLDALCANPWIFWVSYILLGPTLGVCLWFVPASADATDVAVYHGDLLIPFTCWYFVCNLVTCIAVYYKFPFQKFGVMLLLAGYTNGILEHIDVFLNDLSLYDRNIHVYKLYMFYMGILTGTLPGSLVGLPRLYWAKAHWAIIVMAISFACFATYWFLDIAFINTVPFGPDIAWHIEHSIFHASGMISGVIMWIYATSIPKRWFVKIDADVQKDDCCMDLFHCPRKL